MNVLALEAYYGGSHRQFLDGWVQRSEHDWTVLTLPPHSWKWRMRHSAMTFADQCKRLVQEGKNWDIVFVSDMTSLAEFRGLAPAAVHALPSLFYFHENQLTYPVRVSEERDHHFGVTNMVSAHAADAVWFNSAYHRDVFLEAIGKLLRIMPDQQPPDIVENIRERSSVRPPPIERFADRDHVNRSPLRILWNARWEHDKGPETFFEALYLLNDRDVSFQVDVVGESFRRVPEVFAEARGRLDKHIGRWGFQESRAEYLQALGEADVVVSTADHEFFGIAVAEAVAAGAFPLVPNRLAYPEVIGSVAGGDSAEFLYDGSREQLAQRLERLVERKQVGGLWPSGRCNLQKEMDRYCWQQRVPQMDAALRDI